MYAGKIVEMGTSKDIFSNPLHPYTKSLLSAIPQPDPDYEKNRKRINYNPNLSEYRDDKPSLREITKGHFIYVNEKEFKEISNNLKSNIKE
jgi:oligopeptide transport system ATP-binding protein